VYLLICKVEIYARTRARFCALYTMYTVCRQLIRIFSIVLNLHEPRNILLLLYVTHFYIFERGFWPLYASMNSAQPSPRSKNGRCAAFPPSATSLLLYASYFTNSLCLHFPPSEINDIQRKSAKTPVLGKTREPIKRQLFILQKFSKYLEAILDISVLVICGMYNVQVCLVVNLIRKSYLNALECFFSAWVFVNAKNTYRKVRLCIA
jgi:hypothetical protein